MEKYKTDLPIFPKYPKAKKKWRNGEMEKVYFFLIIK